jgi:hypothetical protein
MGVPLDIFSQNSLLRPFVEPGFYQAESAREHLHKNQRGSSKVNWSCLSENPNPKSENWVKASNQALAREESRYANKKNRAERQ